MMVLILHQQDVWRAEAEYGELKRHAGMVVSEMLQENNLETTGEAGEIHTINPKLQSLQELNPDVIGWIEIPESNIDYPVMQGDNNQYYMDHTFYGTESAAGSVFMETQNRSDFSDLVTFVYGHRMRDGSMFGNLKYYEDSEYWAEHPEIYISTYAEEITYEIFSVHRAAVGSDTYTLFFEAGDTYERYLQSEKEKSWYDTGVEVDKNDRILVLVTCTADQKNERIVVLGRRK